MSVYADGPFHGTDTGKTLFDGKYRVFALDPESKTPYRIQGPRGEWVLMRNQRDPHMMFPLDTAPKPTKIRGYTWFMDRGNGNIEPKY